MNVWEGLSLVDVIECMACVVVSNYREDQSECIGKNIVFIQDFTLRE